MNRFFKFDIKKLILITSLVFSCAAVFSQAQQRDALVLYREGNYTEAIAICEQELISNPENIDSYCVLCWSLVRNRQYAEAEQRSTDARKISPYDVRLIEIQAEAKYYLGKRNEALSLFQTYLASAPANAGRIGNAYYFMGEIYIRQEKYNHADMSFTAAVHTEPLIDYWWTRCGYAREMAANYDLALTAYEKVLELNPSQQDATRGRDRVLAKLR